MTSATSWARRRGRGEHRRWLGSVELGERGAQSTLVDYLGAADALVLRRDALEREIDALVPGSPWAEQVGRLRCLRGLDTLSAVGLCAEVGDFERFERPGQLMSYLGLVPSEDSSGQRRRQGAITKTGSRRALPTVGRGRLALPPPPRRRATRCGAVRPARTRMYCAIAWQAQQRLLPRLAAPRQRAWQASHDRRRRRRAQSWPASAGRSRAPTAD